jgi:nucleoid-associated protein YgaU
VTKYTEEVANLIRIDKDLHRPPICKLLWGKLHLFRGVLTNLSQQFTLFQADGTPVRATLGCSFTQFRSTDLTLKELDLHSADVPKTRTVRQGDTLSSIAAEEYHDASLWRHIAAANRLHNPRALTPGQVLRLPKLLA